MLKIIRTTTGIPFYNNCASSGTTKATARMIDANNKQFGIIELKFSNVCKTAWAKITLDKAVPSGWDANTYVKRNTDGKELSCRLSWRKRKSAPGADILLYTDGL